MTTDTCFTKKQFNEDTRSSQEKKEEALAKVFEDKLWKVTIGIPVIPRAPQKDNLLQSTPTKYRDGNNKKKSKSFEGTCATSR